jgi:hypothetical protein
LCVRRAQRQILMVKYSVRDASYGKGYEEIADRLTNKFNHMRS